MEDRATLRISSQHLANWQEHGIITREDMIAVFERMAKVLDRQNAGVPDYILMSPDFEHSLSFRAVCALALQRVWQPNGYSEPLLHGWRREYKKRQESIC